MKRCLLLFVFLFALIPPSAALGGAEYFDGSDGALYIGENNYIYKTGEADAILAQSVRSIIAVTDETVYYTADVANADSALLYAYDLDQTADPREVARVACDAVYSPSDELIYYAPASDDSVLMAYDIQNDGYISSAQSDKAIISLRFDMDGLRVMSESGEKFFSPSAHSLSDIEEASQISEIIPFSEGELTIDADGRLYAATLDAVEPESIDSGVVSAAASGGAVYYIQKTDAASSLLKYDLTSQSGETLEDYDEVMRKGLTSFGENLYFIGTSGVLYQYSLDGKLTTPFAFIDTGVVKEPYPLALSNLLLIYDRSAAKNASFVRKIDLDTYTPADDGMDMQEGDDIIPETEYAELSLGSRGDDVVKLQTSLKTLGYLAGSADGIFGNATLNAVKLLQKDMGLEQTGIADSELLFKIFGGEAARYEPQAGLKKGDSGSEVTKLQDRLRTLYYMVAKASGTYDDYTSDAVKRYQSQMKHAVSGDITDAELEEIHSKKAKKYESYLPLQSGDNAPAVKRLGTRLNKLGYMSQSATDSYNKNVVRAMKLFESYNGLRETGKASVKRLELIYSSKAKHYYPVPTPTPERKYITDKQLKKMRSWMNKNLGTNYSKAQAIEALQIKLMDLGFMAGSASRKYDADTYNCVKEAQRAFGLKVTGVANVDTLVAMFMSVG